jgi:hypothetical protein
MGNYRALLTADVGPDGLAEARLYARGAGIPHQPDLVQVPHQGSRRNVTPLVLDAWLGPRVANNNSERCGIAFCMVGESKDDHPRRIVSNAFTRRGYPVQVGRGKGMLYSDADRPGWTRSSNYEPLWDQVEDYT